MVQHTVTLANEVDWPGFRREARSLLARLVPPEAVLWRTPHGPAQDVTAAPPVSAVPAQAFRPQRAAPPAQGAMSVVVPPAFLTLCEKVVLHADPDRFGLLYRLLWRLVHERALRHDPGDADRARARHMMQAVRRDLHKMKSILRFRPLVREGLPPLHVAWFAPEHHIVEAAAPFFVRRFATLRWAIFTPERSVQWTPFDDADNTATAFSTSAGPRELPARSGDAPPPGALVFGPGAARAELPPADAGDALWLARHARIFHPVTA